MSLFVHPPQGKFSREKAYVAQWVLNEVLGLDVSLSDPVGTDWEIRHAGISVKIPNLFFPEQDLESYLTDRMLPREIRWINAAQLALTEGLWVEKRLPIFWAKSQVVNFSDIDCFGTIFFFLTRFEEVVSSNMVDSSAFDGYGRYLASRSISANDNILARPIVDEYVETLWDYLQRKFPGLTRKQPIYRFLLSHDVDVPTQWDGAGVGRLIRRVSGDLLKRRSLKAAQTRVQSYFDPALDNTNCFSWIMDRSEKKGLVSSFYFVASRNHKHDPGYDVGAPFFEKMIHGMIERGHEVGIHGSYLSAYNRDLLIQEKHRLESICKSTIQGGRQHFLRFQVPDTWRIWESAGLSYDSSLAYAEKAGFRCGTSREFPVFDVREGRPLSLRERPLLVMEHTLLSPAYESLTHEQAFSRIKAICESVRKYSGQMTLLWHNHNLITEENRQLYLAALDHCS